LQIADCRLQIADCRLQIADCRLWGTLMVCTCFFGRRRRSPDLALMCSVQRRTIESLSGRLDLVQRDAEMALEALTEAESRIADLEARAWRLQIADCRLLITEGRIADQPQCLPAAIPELAWLDVIVGS
jgi:hypothetical protein